MRIAKPFKSIFGKRALGQASSVDYVDWAGDMLVKGFDSRSLRILAGLDRSAFASSSEAEGYFLRSVVELNVDVPDSEQAIRLYGCEIAERIVTGDIAGREGVRALYQLCLATNYHADFIVWLELDDALDSLLHGGYPHTYNSATLENFDETAKREAANFMAAMCPDGNEA